VKFKLLIETRDGEDLLDQPVVELRGVPNQGDVIWIGEPVEDGTVEFIQWLTDTAGARPDSSLRADWADGIAGYISVTQE
jgi:hypothetical protein